MQLRQRFLRAIFHLLYHQFAWTYDWVAAVVSLGRWKAWVLSLLPDLAGPRVLELGHGPGHLQKALLENGVWSVGLDRSPQMNLLAQRRLIRQGKTPLLVNALAQQLPFSEGSFHQVVATFPTEFLLDPKTLREVHRVLFPGGTFLSLPATLITSKGLLARGLAWLFRVTGQTISPDESWKKHIADVFTAAGFNLEIEVREEAFSTLVLIRAVARPIL